MYIQKTYSMEGVRIIEKYYPGNYGAPGHSRRDRERPTPLAVEAQNRRKRAQHIQRLIIQNFGKGDQSVTLTYFKDKRPPDTETAKKDIRAFRRKVKDRLKKDGIEYKWICITEVGARGAYHHHLIMTGMDPKTISELWPNGAAHVSPLYEDGMYKDLAEYFVKEETKELVDGCTYTRSRNLKDVEPTIEKRHARRWKEDPPVPRGWELIKDTLINSINPITGYPYQKYMLRKIQAVTRRRQT